MSAKTFAELLEKAGNPYREPSTGKYTSGGGGGGGGGALSSAEELEAYRTAGHALSGAGMSRGDAQSWLEGIRPHASAADGRILDGAISDLKSGARIDATAGYGKEPAALTRTLAAAKAARAASADAPMVILGAGNTFKATPEFKAQVDGNGKAISATRSVLGAGTGAGRKLGVTPRAMVEVPRKIRELSRANSALSRYHDKKETGGMATEYRAEQKAFKSLPVKIQDVMMDNGYVPFKK